MFEKYFFCVLLCVIHGKTCIQFNGLERVGLGLIVVSADCETPLQWVGGEAVGSPQNNAPQIAYPLSPAEDSNRGVGILPDGQNMRASRKSLSTLQAKLDERFFMSRREACCSGSMQVGSFFAPPRVS